MVLVWVRRTNLRYTLQAIAVEMGVNERPLAGGLGKCFYQQNTDVQPGDVPYPAIHLARTVLAEHGHRTQ